MLQGFDDDGTVRKENNFTILAGITLPSIAMVSVFISNPQVISDIAFFVLMQLILIKIYDQNRIVVDVEFVFGFNNGFISDQWYDRHFLLPSLASIGDRECSECTNDRPECQDVHEHISFI